MPDFAADLIKLGSAGVICVVLLWCLHKSEQREAKKDQRIQYLENMLIQSYDERIAAADKLATALQTNATTMESLVHGLRDRRHA